MSIGEVVVLAGFTLYVVACAMGAVGFVALVLRVIPCVTDCPRSERDARWDEEVAMLIASFVFAVIYGAAAFLGAGFVVVALMSSGVLS